MGNGAEIALVCHAAEYMGDHARNSPEEALEPSILDMICHLLAHPDKRKPLVSLLDALGFIRSRFYASGNTSSRIDAEDLGPEPPEIEMPTLFGTALDFSEHYRSNALSDTIIITATSDDMVTELGDEEPWEIKIKSSRIPEVTVLHLAASMALAKIASLLLKETTNIDAVDETGKAALALALERGFEKAVELLVNSSACVDLRHDHGQGVLLLFSERDWRVAADTIVGRARATVDQDVSNAERHQLSLLLATYDGQINQVRQMKKEHTLDLMSDHRRIGEISLFLAVEKQDMEMVPCLLDLLIDFNAKDNSGVTALHRATHRKNEPLARLLLSHGAMVDCKDDDGRTPWNANTRSGDHHHILSFLREAGADPSTRGLQGVSELYTAAKDGETEIVKYMLESGTNPLIQTNYQRAPLHLAASYGHIECVRLMIAAGADVSVISDQRVTPLDLALQAGQTAVVTMLSVANGKHYQGIRPPPLTAQSTQLEEEGEWVSIQKTEQGDPTSSSQPDSVGLSIDPTKLRLVYDKPLVRTLKYSTAVGQYVYVANTSGPSENIYEVSHVLETHTSAISVRHSPTRAEMWDYPLASGCFNNEDVLYDIVRMRLDYQEFELRGRHQDHLPGTIRMHRDWTGGWRIRHDHDSAGTLLFRITSDWTKNKDEDCRWTTEDGVLLARSGWEDLTPKLCSETGLELKMHDVMVTCWIAKLWSETAALQRHERGCSLNGLSHDSEALPGSI